MTLLRATSHCGTSLVTSRHLPSGRARHHPRLVALRWFRRALPMVMMSSPTLRRTPLYARLACVVTHPALLRTPLLSLSHCTISSSSCLPCRKCSEVTSSPSLPTLPGDFKGDFYINYKLYSRCTFWDGRVKSHRLVCDLHCSSKLNPYVASRCASIGFPMWFFFGLTYVTACAWLYDTFRLPSMLYHRATVRLTSLPVTNSLPNPCCRPFVAACNVVFPSFPCVMHSSNVKRVLHTFLQHLYGQAVCFVCLLLQTPSLLTTCSQTFQAVIAQLGSAKLRPEQRPLSVTVACDLSVSYVFVCHQTLVLAAVLVLCSSTNANTLCNFCAHKL
jgi:hypothetical protein